MTRMIIGICFAILISVSYFKHVDFKADGRFESLNGYIPISSPSLIINNKILTRFFNDFFL